MTSASPLTQGTHHIGLTVSNLEASANFFIKLLGWKEVRRDPDYPAIFVSDGKLMVTLWQTKQLPEISFDKNRNIGLHHLALSVDSFATLDVIHEKIVEHGLKVEFAPELLRNGPAKHMMCYDPNGIRIEFICVPDNHQ